MIMPLKENFETQLYTAIRNKDEDRKRTIRMVLSNIKLVEVEQKRILDDKDILSIVRKEIKIREEKIEDAKKAGRESIIQEAKKEIAVLQDFLPETMDQQDLVQIANGVIQELNAHGLKDMGAVMKMTIKQVNGRASNEEISRVVKDLLQKD